MPRLLALSLLVLLPVAVATTAGGPAVWFASWQHGGHIRALAPLARELRRRGWAAALVLHEEARRYAPEGVEVVSAGPLPWTWEEELGFRDLLFSAGPPPNQTMTPEQANEASERRAAASEEYFLGSQRSLAQGLRKALELRAEEHPGAVPPLIVADVASPGALDVAELLGLRHAVFSSWPVGPTLQAIADDCAFAFPWLPSELHMFPQSAEQHGLLDRTKRMLMSAAAPVVLHWAGFHAPRWRLRAELGLPPLPQLELMEPPRAAGGGRPLVLLATHWALDRPRPLPPHIRLVGPMENYTAQAAARPAVKETLLRWLSAQELAVYVSLGTNVRPRAAQLQALVEGMRLLPEVRFLWDVREGMLEALGPLPDNVRAEASLEQLPVLASGRVRAFVSHCGLNSLHEAAHFGVPIVGLPFVADQLISARVVEEVGMGLRLSPGNLTAAAFAEAVAAVARGEAYAAASRRVGRLAARAGGAAAAAELLELLRDEGVGHLQMRGKDGPAGRLWDVYLVVAVPALALAAALRCWFCPPGAAAKAKEKAA